MKVPWSDSEWRRVAVYGLGVSGRAAAALLQRHGIEVVAVDDRPREELNLESLEPLGISQLLVGGELEGRPDDVHGLDGVVVSPGVPPERPLLVAARRRGLPIIAEVELAFRFLEGEVVGITGSNGKSTTTALTGAMLEAAGRRVEVCGNIGAALSERVAAAATAHAGGDPERVFVVELSSFQLEGIDRFHPHSAALLNISHDHLDRHGDLESYRAAKTAIFGRQEAGDLAVLNAEDPLVAETRVTAHRRFFSSRNEVGDGCYLAGDVVVETVPGEQAEELFRPSDVPLPGPHNLENAMAAALLARAHGASKGDIEAGMRAFRGLPHRLELVVERDGVVWYDDSKGTNLAATERSLQGFEDGRVLIILGGRAKGGDFSQLTPLIKRKARRVYLIGEATPNFERALAPEVSFESVGTLDRAVARAVDAARAGDVVLLSPACSSFDQFLNFAQRGRMFQRLVKALPGGELGTQAGI